MSHKAAGMEAYGFEQVVQVYGSTELVDIFQFGLDWVALASPPRISGGRNVLCEVGAFALARGPKWSVGSIEDSAPLGQLTLIHLAKRRLPGRKSAGWCHLDRGPTRANTRAIGEVKVVHLVPMTTSQQFELAIRT